MSSTGTSLFSGLATLGAYQEINGMWFNQKVIILDGYKFSNCRFDGCTLHVNSLNFELISCHVDAKTVIIYGGEAIKILKLYNSRNDYAFQHLAVFAPVKNSDGTINIQSI